MAESPRLSVTALPLAKAAGLWSAFAPGDCWGTAQSRHWAQCWAGNVNPEIFCGVIFRDDAPLLVLPVEIVRENGCRLARYIGGSHANANFPLVRRDFARDVTPELANAVLKALFLAVDRLDAVILSRQQPEIGGLANPFAALTSQASPNLALSFAVEESFDQLIKHRSGARKLKKMRQQARRMDERGGWQCAVADDTAEARRLLDAFFVMKAKRFEEFGLKDTFERREIKDFFKALFDPGAADGSARFRLDALQVGGEILAVAGSSMRHGSNIVEFGAVRAHEPTLSPGDFLFHQMIKRACEDGTQWFDFGVGDEPYKRAWCDVETQHFETVRGYTARGVAYAQLYKIAIRAKLAIKRNAALFGLVKALRMRNASEGGGDPA